MALHLIGKPRVLETNTPLVAIPLRARIPLQYLLNSVSSSSRTGAVSYQISDYDPINRNDTAPLSRRGKEDCRDSFNPRLISYVHYRATDNERD